jgi:hypothetical protein
MSFARTIVEEPQVSAAVDAAETKFPRFGALWNAWTWRLARGPAIQAYKIPNTYPDTYLIKSPDLSQYALPHSITIMYRFTDDEVHILDLRIVE